MCENFNLSTLKTYNTIVKLNSSARVSDEESKARITCNYLFLFIPNCYNLHCKNNDIFKNGFSLRRACVIFAINFESIANRYAER